MPNKFKSLRNQNRDRRSKRNGRLQQILLSAKKTDYIHHAYFTNATTMQIRISLRRMITTSPDADAAFVNPCQDR